MFVPETEPKVEAAAEVEVESEPEPDFGFGPSPSAQSYPPGYDFATLLGIEDSLTLDTAHKSRLYELSVGSLDRQHLIQQHGLGCPPHIHPHRCQP